MRIQKLGATFALLCAGLFVASAHAQQFSVSLSGVQEVPPNGSSATGTAQVSLAPDLSVSGSISTTGVSATAAHIHTGAAGTNGPVIVPFVRSGDNAWVIAPGARLSPAQGEALRAGSLYINVHSAAYPGGEIRGQIR